MMSWWRSMRLRTLLALLVGLTLASASCKPAKPAHGEAEAGHAHKDGDDHKGDGDHKGGDAPGHEEEGVVKLTPEAIKRAGVRVAPVAEGVGGEPVEIPAEVQPNPDRVAHVNPLVEGQLLTVNATFGDQVKAGAKLATLRSIALGDARAELVHARALMRIAKKELERQKTLRAERISSERALLKAQLDMEEAEAREDAALARLLVFGVKGGSGPDTALVSPISGVVLNRHATRGENVSPQQTLFVIADLSRVLVIGRVPERHVRQVRAGMKASLMLHAYPSRVWTGRVEVVDAALDEQTRTLAIRIALDNAEGLLKPGLYGSLRLTPADAGGDHVALVPAEAVQQVGAQRVVFVPGDHGGAFARRAVTVGRRSGDMLEIVRGVKPGEPVVVSGAFVLKSELMRAQLGHGHAH